MLNARLKQILALIHSVAQESVDFEESLADIEAHTALLKHRLLKTVHVLTRVESAGLCANCLFPLCRKNGELEHFMYATEAGNKCRIPALEEKANGV